MRLAKAISMRVTASRPRKASCLACASFNSPRSAACNAFDLTADLALDLAECAPISNLLTGPKAK